MTARSALALAVEPADLEQQGFSPPPGLWVAPSARVPLVIDDATVLALHPILVRVAQRLVGRRALAEDVVQDAWLSALRSAHAYQGRSSLLTWLVAIVRRRAFDARRQTRRRMLELEEDCVVVEPDWIDRVHARELLESMRGGLAELSEREQRALLLCDVQELDRDEAADALGVTRGHLRVLLHRGHNRARAAARRELVPC